MSQYKKKSSKISRILFVGWFDYPFGSAAASNVRHMTQGLQLKGIKSHIITTRRIMYRNEDLHPTGYMAYDGTIYETTNCFETDETKLKKNVFTRVGRLISAYRKSWKRVEELVKTGTIDAIILYSRSYLQINPIIKICKRYKVSVFVFAVEWYYPKIFPFPGHAIDWFLGMNLSYRKLDGAIAISTFLRDKFCDYGIPSIITPSMQDTSRQGDQNLSESSNVLPPPKKQMLNLVYVGQFKPDEDVDSLLKGVCIARELGCPVELLIIGNDGRTGSGKKVKRRIRRMGALKGHAHFLGRLPDDKYYRCLNSADAMVMLRRPITRSLAAFPVRIPEFLATGNPLITNAVPDIPRYLNDKVHAHVVPFSRPDLIAERIEDIYAHPQKNAVLGIAGKHRIKECFDFRMHTENIANFIELLSYKNINPNSR